VEDVDGKRDGERHVGGGDLLHHDRPCDRRQPRAADGLREGTGQQPELGHPAHEPVVELLGLVALDGARRDHAG
jgi:hypothetical protein